MSNKDIEQRIKKTSEYQLAPDGKGNNTTPQLPVEVVKKIRQEAREYAKSHGRKEIGYYAFNWEAGATAYATKLQEVQQENDRLKIALGNVYRIHGHQWSEYDRNVIKELIK